MPNEFMKFFMRSCVRGRLGCMCTSDALALAVRFSCPIYTYEHILENAGILMDDTSNKKTSPESLNTEQFNSDHENLSSLGIEELQILLNEVLEQEDYIRAISIRDEIQKRKK